MTSIIRHPISAVLFDIQGTLITGDGAPIAGAADAVAAIRRSGLAVRFVTNIDSVPIHEIVARLQAAGIHALATEIFSPVTAALRFLARQDRTRCHLLLPESLEPEFESYRAQGTDVDWVVVGDCREGFTYERLNVAFRLLREGAGLLALQKGRWWPSPNGPALDTGAFVSALEFAAATQAHVVGKPSLELMRAAIDDVGCDPYDAVLIGDDVCSDVPGAHAIGARSILVRTGKFSLSALERSERKPDLLLDSVADLPPAMVELVA